MSVGLECARSGGLGAPRCGATVVGHVVLVTLCGVGNVSGQTADPAMAPLARAAELMDLRQESTGPFLLRVKARLLGLVTGDREGDYTLLLSSPDAWFESTRFPGYADLEGRSGSRGWRKRNVLEKPYRMHQLSLLLDPSRHLRLASGARVQKTWTGEGGLACFKVGPTRDLWQHDRSGISALPPLAVSDSNPVTLCFDAASGVLRRADYGLPLPRYEYEGEVVRGARHFPATMKCYEARDLAIEATVVELTADTVREAAEFAVPEGAEAWPFCAEPAPPHMIAKREAEHYAKAQAKGQFGTVVVLAEVGRDGILHDLAFVDSRGKLLRLGIEKVVDEWKYQPATCNGESVPYPIYIKYTFLQR
jgi:hypothetical protein